MKNRLLQFTRQNNQLIIRMTVILLALGLGGLPAYAQIISTYSASRCGEGSVVLGATASGGTIKWYDSPFYGNVLGTGSTFTTPYLSVTTTYYADAVDDANCSVNTGKTRVAVIATITGNTVQSVIFYSSNTFCKSVSGDQAVTQTGTHGGVFTVSPSGLIINSTNGAITPSSSSNGTYTVTYTVEASEGCTENPATTQVTITTAPEQPTISYSGSPYCNNSGTAVHASRTGATGGSYSASPSGLIIANADGTITPTGSLPGTYTISYFVPGTGGCSPLTASAEITITEAPKATIAYSSAAYCKNNTTVQSPTLSGTGAYTGGSYSYSGTGTLSMTTGSGSGAGNIDPSASDAGTYTVSYTVPSTGNCSSIVASTTVTIYPIPSATIAGTTSACQEADAPLITFTGSNGQAPYTFTYNINGGGNLTVTTSSGNSVDLSQPTTSAGTFVYNLTQVSDANGCIYAASGSVTITVTPFANASFSYPNALYCTSGTATPSMISGGIAGTFTAEPASLSINSSTGIIDVAASPAGAYTVTNTVTTCGKSVNASVPVSIGHVNPVISGGESATCGSTTLTASADASVTSPVYQWQKEGVDMPDQNTATLTASVSGTYSVKVTDATTGCVETSTGKSITIHSAPDCSVAGPSLLIYGSSDTYTAPAEMSSYSWSITQEGDVLSGSIDGSTDGSSVTVKAIAKGSFNLNLTITNSDGCSATCSRAVFVDPAELTITAVDQSIPYKTPVINVTDAGSYSVSGGYKYADDIHVISGTATYTTTYTEDTNAGTSGVTITPVVTGLSASNYTFKAANGTITIIKAESTITATGATSFTYNGSQQGPDGITKTGSSGAVTYSYSGTVNGGATYGPSSTKPTLAGSYQVIATVAADDNYNGKSSDPLDFAINRATPAVEFTATTSFTYNGNAQSPTLNVTGSNPSTGAISYSYAGTGSTTYSSTTAPTNAGTYTVTGTIAQDNNYESKTTLPLAFTITKAESTITATGATSFTYNGLQQGPDGFTKTGSTASITYSYSGKDKAGVTYSASTDKPTLAGDYKVIASVASDANYNEKTLDPVDFTINQVVLTVTAEDKSKTYDGNAFTQSSYTSKIEGFISGENSSVITGTVTYSGTAITATAVGTYAITPVITGLSATNYSFTPVGGTLTINKAVLTVTAGNQNVTYGTAVATVTGAGTYEVSGYIASDNVSVITGLDNITYNTTYTTTTNVGTTGITITPEVSSLSATNYSFTPVGGTLTINKAVLTVTAGNQNVTYGTAVATVTGAGTKHIEGFKSSDTESVITGTVTYTTNYTITTAVAETGITLTPDVSSLSATNYSFTPADGTLTIYPAAPSVNSSQYFCYGATVGTLDPNTSKWYSNPTGGTALGTSDLLTNATTYFATQTVNGLESIDRAPVAVTVHALPTLSGVTQDGQALADNPATIKLSGLLPNSTSTVEYTINGVTQTSVTSVSANASGEASFQTGNLALDQNGKALVITKITVTSTTPNCSQSFSISTTLSVNASIGANYKGGKVGYLLQSGDPGFVGSEQHGLIISSADLSTSASWGCSGTSISTSDAIGSGSSNTANIIAGCATEGIAARLCNDYSVIEGGTTYDDWYLPSKEELKAIYQSNQSASLGIPSSDYWSSSSINATTSAAIYFYDGSISTVEKSATRRVRAVRAF